MKIRGLHTFRGWYYYWPPQIDGLRPKRIALRTKDLETALDLAFDLQRKQVAHASGQRLSGEVERYLKAKKDRDEFRPKTLVVTESGLRVFQAWAGNPSVVDVTPKMIQEWHEFLVSKGYGTASIVTYLRRVQSFFSWLVESGRLLKSPFDEVRIPKVKRAKAISFCTIAQRNQLVNNCEREDLLFVLMAGFYLGLRRMEIIEAVPEWFRTPGICEVTRTPTYLPKDKERRVVHYGKRFSDFLEGYGLREPFMLRPEVKRKKSLYRYDPRRPFETFVMKQGLPWVTMHTMRHTFATLHIQAGTPLATVADWLGDSYDVTFKHYSAYAPSEIHIQNIDS